MPKVTIHCSRRDRVAQVGQNIGSYNAHDEPRLRIHGMSIDIDLQPIPGRPLILMARSIGGVIEGLGEWYEEQDYPQE